ncbi:MAG: TraR/DksA family transcriptional regulator [Candidatus Brocadiia bacterium]
MGKSKKSASVKSKKISPKKPALPVKKENEPKLVKTNLSASLLKQLKNILLARKAIIEGDLGQMGKETLGKSRIDASGDLSNLPLHAADQGTDTFEQDFTIGLMENEGEEIKQIEEALNRIEEKTYGMCESCNKPVPEARLRVVPFAKFCIKCQSKNENRR